MKEIFIVLMMIFCHIIDDYKLQGILASMKQKKWWQEQKEYKNLYKYDYIWALITHSFSWSFMIMLPIIFIKSFEIKTTFLIVFILNMITHAVVDDLKANKFKINLIQDQIIHLIQIVVTAIILL